MTKHGDRHRRAGRRRFITSLWNAALITAGYVLGAQWERVADAIGPVATPMLVLSVVGIAGFMLVRALRRRRAT